MISIHHAALVTAERKVQPRPCVQTQLEAQYREIQNLRERVREAEASAEYGMRDRDSVDHPLSEQRDFKITGRGC